MIYLNYDKTYMKNRHQFLYKDKNSILRYKLSLVLYKHIYYLQNFKLNKNILRYIGNKELEKVNNKMKNYSSIKTLVNSLRKFLSLKSSIT